MFVYQFSSEQEAEQFCSDGYPKYGKDQNSVTRTDVGVTLRAAKYEKDPKKDVWYVKDTPKLEARAEQKKIVIDWDVTFPRPKLF